VPVFSHVAADLAGQSGAARPEPFKLGTFERSGQTFLGIVLRATQVAERNSSNKRPAPRLRRLPPP
jgi:hypothetical protein